MAKLSILVLAICAFALTQAAPQETGSKNGNYNGVLNSNQPGGKCDDGAYGTGNDNGNYNGILNSGGYGGKSKGSYGGYEGATGSSNGNNNGIFNQGGKGGKGGAGTGNSNGNNNGIGNGVIGECLP